VAAKVKPEDRDVENILHRTTIMNVTILRRVKKENVL
jgi:hypothetical protein